MPFRPTLTLAALAASVAVAAPTTAPADEKDVGGAVPSTARDEIDARLNDASGADGDITCTAQAKGGPVTPAASFGVGELYAQDIVLAHAACVSSTHSTYTMSLTVKIQVFSGGSWIDAGCPATTTRALVVNGVGVAPTTTTTCNHGDSPDAGRYRRAIATLSQSVSSKSHTETSAAWYSARPAASAR